MDNGDTQKFELDQFNLDTTSEDWGNQTPETPAIPGNNQAINLEHNQRALGNIATRFPGSNPNVAPNNPLSPEFPSSIISGSTTPELGQISSATPPGFMPPEPQDSPEAHPATDIHTATLIQKVQNGGNLTSAEAKFIENDFNNSELADAYDRYRPEPSQEQIS